MARVNRAAIAVVAAGVAAAMHVGKLPPALPLLREYFGMSLVHASFLVSVFQLAGLSLGIVGGMLADRFGPRRVMIFGLLLVAGASAAATGSPGSTMLLVTRAVESAGFILTVLPGTALLRREVAPERLSVWLGYWAAYMPAGMGLALVVTPWLLELAGWQAVWLAVAAVSMALAAMIFRTVTPDGHARSQAPDMRALIVATVRTPGPWVLALAFGCYAAQWMGVFSFLPTIYQAAGIDLTTAGWLTAAAVIVNLIGNIAGGWLAHRRWPAHWVIVLGAVAMAAGAWLAFGTEAPFMVRYGGVVVLSMVGGLVPGTLFTIAPALAPVPSAVSTTVGLMQQGSALGQFVSPPVLAVLASGASGWSHTWQVTGLFALGDVLAAWMLWRLLRVTHA